MDTTLSNMNSFAIPPSTGAYSTTVCISQRVKDTQPFGALGGMPKVCEFLGLRLGMSRVRIDYMLNSCQNAHCMLLVAAADKEHAIDAVHECVQFAGSTDAMRNERIQAIPDFDKALAEHVSKDWVKDAHWLPSTSVGRYGALHVSILTQLQAAQQSAYVIEADTCKGATPYITTCGFATLTLEKCPEVDVRLMRTEEAVAAVSMMESHVNDCIATAKDEIPHCRGAFRWALQQKLEGYEATRDMAVDAQSREDMSKKLMGLGEGGDGVPGRCLRKAKDSTPVIHLNVVSGHPAHKGAGKAALTRLCELADELQLPVVLEALPNEKLPIYYTQYGFQAVVLGTTNATTASLFRQGFIIMWREPRQTQGMPADEPVGAGAGAGAAASKPDVDGIRRAVDALTDEGKLAPYTTRHRDNKLDHLHLSPLSEAWVNSQCVFNTKNVLLSMATWARELARQVKAGELTTFFNVPSDDEMALADTEDSTRIPKGVTTHRKRPRAEDEAQAPSRVMVMQPAAGSTSGSMTIPMPGGQTGNHPLVFNFSNCTVNIYVQYAS